jgi:hypothetical protein
MYVPLVFAIDSNYIPLAGLTSGTQNANILAGFKSRLPGLPEELIPYHNTVYTNIIYL